MVVAETVMERDVVDVVKQFEVARADPATKVHAQDGGIEKIVRVIDPRIQQFHVQNDAPFLGRVKDTSQPRFVVLHPLSWVHVATVAAELDEVAITCLRDQINVMQVVFG
ncbi:hypothetical protein P775_05130 [Puniceibacterium antarcticum]|uniref:Uncharacterized protein n=1 Tax=Puniceibacterium antarcticum TaxID=1206336 RepID=A0A2G8RII6_9RHOB|nr:hypothetical protein P775_05130 [Puniceibacterium antarcticum]